jgi:hypothetical protein
MSKRRVWVPAAALVLAAAMFAVAGSASSLGGLDSGMVAAGKAANARCDGDGVTAEFEVDFDAVDERDEVVAVTVSGIATVCGGGTLRLTLSRGMSALASAGPITVPAGGGSTMVAVPIPPHAQDVDGVHVLLYKPS